MASVYFNSETKTMISHRFRLENSFQKNLYMIDVCLIKDLVGMLNQSSLNTLTIQLIDLYQEVLIWTYLLNRPLNLYQEVLILD